MMDNNKPLCIQSFRVLAKFQQEHVQIFFQEKRDPMTGKRLRKKEPVTLFINNAGILNEYPLECISCIKVRLVDEPRITFICDKKVRLEIGFIIYLVVKFEGNQEYELIVLPQDLGIDVNTLYDLTEKQIANSVVQTMQWVGDRFVYTLTATFDEFDGIIPPGLIASNTLIGNVTLRNTTWTFDIDGVSFDGTGSPPVLATRVDLAIFQDIIIRIGIEQGILVDGEVD